MGMKQQITEALSAKLEPGEHVLTWRQVVANAKIDSGDFDTTLALLGPSVYVAAIAGAVVGQGSLPARTNLVVVTDRRLLWCSKNRLGNEIVVGGADPLGALATAEIVAARIALAKLRFTFRDGSSVQFDLPSDHRVDEFVDTLNDSIGLTSAL